MASFTVTISAGHGKTTQIATFEDAYVCAQALPAIARTIGKPVRTTGYSSKATIAADLPRGVILEQTSGGLLSMLARP